MPKDKQQTDDKAEIQLTFLNQSTLLNPELLYVNVNHPAFPNVFFFTGGMFTAFLNRFCSLHVYLEKNLEYCFLVLDGDFYLAPADADMENQDILDIIAIHTK